MNQKGFTLIELVVTVVVIAILAVTALPKVMNLTTEAKISVLKATEGAVKSGDNMIIARSTIEGKEKLSNGKLELQSGVDKKNNPIMVELKTINGHLELKSENVKHLISSDLNVIDTHRYKVKGEDGNVTDETRPQPGSIAIYFGDEVDLFKEVPKCYLNVRQIRPSGEYTYHIESSKC